MASHNVGSVTQRTVTTVVVDVEAHIDFRVSDPADTLIELRVNGRVIKRMTEWQAKRMGIIADNSGY